MSRKPMPFAESRTATTLPTPQGRIRSLRFKIVAVSLSLVLTVAGLMRSKNLGQTPPSPSRSTPVANNWDFATQTRGGSPVFSSCPYPAFPQFQCTNIVVPKDYFNTSAGTSIVAIAMWPATAKKNKGVIFLNPGGPGGSGVDYAFYFAPMLSFIVDGEYDIVGFDPRGIGYSRPIVNCFDSTFDRTTFAMNTVLERGFDLPPQPFSDEGYDAIVRQWSSWRALNAAQYQLCGEKMGDELKYMGTSTVVRDIDFMAKVFGGEDGLIHYFGGSYGSILGTYLVNMLPDRVGRVVIEGVVNPVLWANAAPHQWQKDWMADTELAYDWLLRECVEVGPKLCALARSNDTVDALSGRLEDWLNSLYHNPIPVPHGYRPGILTGGHARLLLYYATNAPGLWPYIAKLYDDAMKGDVTRLYRTFTMYPTWPPRPDPLGDLARQAVSCADSAPARDVTPHHLANITLDILRTRSPHFALSMPSIEPDGACEFWPTKGQEPERFTGPWNHTLANPMLILSSLADPVTPLASARLVNRMMQHSSRLLIQDTVGHTLTSGAGLTLCVTKVLQQYFGNGTLPPNEMHCPAERGIFVDEVVELERVAGLSPEDQVLQMKLNEAHSAMMGFKLRTAQKSVSLGNM